MRKNFTIYLFIFLFILCAPSRVDASEGLPEFVRVGLEREFKNVSRVNIGNVSLTVGHNVNGSFVPLETYSSSGGFVISNESDTRLTLSAGGQALASLSDSDYPVQIRDGAGGNVLLDGTEYMNTVELYRASGGSFTAVNVLTPQEYLYCVVPSEMSPTFHPEALKAQAVAARSYLRTRLLGVHGSQGYDMCDSGHCLMFYGAERSDGASSSAVDATGGEMAYYNGEPINAVFFSSSGGVTDDSENVWNEEVPYLRGVSDPEEVEPRIWSRSFSWDELSDLLTASNSAIGDAIGAVITKSGAGGRVQELTIQAEAGQKTLTKEGIRTFFSPTDDGSLASRNFTLDGGVSEGFYSDVVITDGAEYKAARLNEVYAVSSGGQAERIGEQSFIHNRALTVSVNGGSGITISGRGWGHGVGMSHKGAEGMARQGYTYREILTHYYSGVEIR